MANVISRYKRSFHIPALLTALLLTAGLLCGYSYRCIPRSFTTSPTGSAKYLDGSTVLVSLFIEDPESSWTLEDKELVMSKLNLVNEFLVEEGNSYGKTVNLIYDINEHPDLSYTVSYSEVIDDSDDSSFDLLDYITEYIDDNIPTQELLASYNVESIAYMCFLNKEGVSYTFPYYEGDGRIYYYETCYMFLKCDGEYEPPSVYAHEILHLFGARDLYASNQTDGITKDFVQYIEESYPNEIMLTTYDADWNNVQDHITNDLTDITAYFIGWLDTIPELDTYPSIRPANTASFSESEDTTGDYNDYPSSETGSHWGTITDDTEETSGSYWGSGNGSTAAPDRGNGNVIDRTAGNSSDSEELFWKLIIYLYKLFR